MSIASDASRAQIAAADPGSNVWLVANAGSGKTRVLTDRVARLLLRGVDPQNILCLTYTKAAAAEMQNRLFKRLGEWAMATDGALRDSLATLGEGGLPEEQLRRARQLFARAIETPGGIRIQTIHSFAGSLLRRFPLEAGVAPGFQEIEDRSAAQLRADVLEEMAEGPDAALLVAVLEESGEDLDRLTKLIVGKKVAFAGETDEAALRSAFGLPTGFGEADLLAQVFLGGEAALVEDLLAVLAGGSAKDLGAADVLRPVRPFSATLETIQAFEDAFLFKATKDPAKSFTAKIGDFPTKDTRARFAARMAALEGLMTRVEAARPLRLALAAAGATARLHRFARGFLRRYEAAKAARGWLDFDDLILRATDVLTDPRVAPWVLYRLDGSLDHVLVDEAQDTSPGQWRIVEALTAEFTAGEGARRDPRSLFVVGDKKQSIYSFQGANVAAFDTVKAEFEGRFAAAGGPLVELPLQHSFRSASAILGLVDRVFEGAPPAALGGAFRHLAFHDAMPGRVDLWPVAPKPAEPDKGVWYDPVDLKAEDDASVVLARRIAAEIGRMIREGVQIPDKETVRPVRAGDFLILVQRRHDIFFEIIRACKAEDLPIAGADRMVLTKELAVRDVLALLAFLNTPEDDLALATALRSPLFGWSEKRLFQLAQGRKGWLWEALRNHPDGGETVAVLHDLRDRAEFLRPYELIERLLTRHGRRPMILGRMGVEAAEALDELLAQALAYERAEAPSLTGFLAWMAAGEVEVKRRPEAEGGLIRVMTVHGAKGLEAPVVILPETADRKLEDRDAILTLPDGVPVWAGRAADNPPVVAAAKEARKAAREEENLRLLYVALTRPKCWLIVAGAGECGAPSWYGMIDRAAGMLPFVEGAGGVRRLQVGDWPKEARVEAPPPQDVSLPDWVGRPALPPPAGVVELSPSGLGGDKVLAAEPPVLPGGDPLLRGSLLHLLLEHLPGRPQGDWAALAERIGAQDVLAEAAGILSESSLCWLFGPGTQAEVSVLVPWNGTRLSGNIDRLVVTPDVVTVVDFKSNAAIPARAEEVPESYLRQLGAYALALEGIYPGRRIDTAILWTRGPQLMRIHRDIVREALGRAAIP